ncbi:unnamed protein product, partial [Prorocentrum cordatum]
TSWLLLSMCANLRANVYWRTMAPEETLEFVAAHDEHMAQLATGQAAREVAQLPLCLGGLGLRCAARMAPAAWWDTWADCLPMLRERAPADRGHLLGPRRRRGQAPTGHRQAAEARRQLAQEGCETPTWTALALGARPPPTQDREMGERAHGWQFWAARAGDDRAREGLVQRMHAPERALLLSQSGPCAGRAFTVLPTSEPMRVPPSELRVLLLRRLRLDLPFTAGASRCRARLDSRRDRRAACPTAGVRKKRRAPLEKATARICREAGARLAVDATLVCPLDRGATAHPRTADEDRARCRLVVMALEVGGRWPQEALHFMRLLADCMASKGSLDPAVDRPRLSGGAAGLRSLHLLLDGLACDGDEPWLQEVLADARYTEAPVPSRMPARP